MGQPRYGSIWLKSNYLYNRRIILQQASEYTTDIKQNTYKAMRVIKYEGERVRRARDAIYKSVHSGTTTTGRVSVCASEMVCGMYLRPPIRACVAARFGVVGMYSSVREVVCDVNGSCVMRETCGARYGASGADDFGSAAS